ncbi:MAG: hypothetical protein GY746_01760, partial [Gammaproteobacteria bacterium]|nr:hypothetical protein [Gammaproteobacteria bacterium]
MRTGTWGGSGTAGTINSLKGIDMELYLMKGTTNYATGISVETIGSNFTNLTYLQINQPTDVAGNFGIYNNSSYDNYFAGNVGIGTTIPDEKLHVAGKVKVEGMASGSTTDSLVSWNPSDKTLRIIPKSDLDDNDWIKSGNDIYSANTGNVGIGESAPVNQLVIRNDGNNFTGNELTLKNRNTTALGTGSRIVFQGYRDTDSNHEVASIEAHHRPGDLNNVVHGAALLFRTNTGDSPYNQQGFERMRITEDGNVGINTSDPAEKLSIGGDGSAIELGAGVAGKETNAGKIAYQRWSVDALDIVGAGTAGNRKIKLYAEGGVEITGNVGIGTTAPAGILDIAGAYHFPGIDGTTGQILQTDGSGTLSWSDDVGATAINDLSDGKTGGNSVFLGSGAGANDDFLNRRNVAVGDSALFTNTIGDHNTATGYRALYYTNSGLAITDNGIFSGSDNTANGYEALLSNTKGWDNTANGAQALYSNTTGAGNTAAGYEALSSNTIGSHNTAIGYSADVSTGNLINATAIGAMATVSQDSSLVLGNAANVGIGTTAPDAKLHIVGRTMIDGDRLE